MLPAFICFVQLSCACYMPVVFWFFWFFLMCVHIPPHSFIFILTIYTAFSPLGFLHTWSRHTIVYTQLEFLIRPQSHQQSNRNLPRATSAHSTARKLLLPLSSIWRSQSIPCACGACKKAWVCDVFAVKYFFNFFFSVIINLNVVQLPKCVKMMVAIFESFYDTGKCYLFHLFQ